MSKKTVSVLARVAMKTQNLSLSAMLIFRGASLLHSPIASRMDCTWPRIETSASYPVIPYLSDGLLGGTSVGYRILALAGGMVKAGVSRLWVRMRQSEHAKERIGRTETSPKCDMIDYLIGAIDEI